MRNEELIKKDLSDQISKIQDKNFLEFLEELVLSHYDTNNDTITAEQEMMLKLSEDDINYGRTTSQEELQEKTKEWLRKRKV